MCPLLQYVLQFVFHYVLHYVIQVVEVEGQGHCVLEAGGYIFNTEAHPIDPAALACCSGAVQNWAKQA